MRVNRAPGGLRLLAGAALAAGTLLVAGCCLIGSEYQLDETIGRQRVEKIRPGETSVNEVLAWLGPPSAIARSNRPLIIPSLSAGKEGALELQPGIFYELFAAKRKIRSEDAVYYYDASRLDESGWLFVLILMNGASQSDRIHAERLWLLVDEKAGMVEAYVYRIDGRNIYGDGALALSGHGRAPEGP